MYWGDQYSEVVVIQLNMHAFSGGLEASPPPPPPPEMIFAFLYTGTVVS